MLKRSNMLHRLASGCGRQRWATLLLACLEFLCVASAAVELVAQTNEQPRQVTFNLLELPSSRQAQAVLNSESRFLWEQTPLRLGLRDLSQVHGISIWIDRELDPTQLVSAAADKSDSTLQNRLEQIAALVGAEVGLIENVVYLGPAKKVSALQLATVELHDAIARSGVDRSAQLRHWQWEELSSSAEMLAQVTTQWQIRLVGELPHDLFHEGQMRQPTTLATQLSLLAGGFDQQAVLLAPGRFQLQPLERRSRWQANYRTSELELRSLMRLKSAYLNSECLTRGEVSQVSGVTNFHLALIAPRADSVGKGKRAVSEAWGFEVRQTPVEAVLEKLAMSLGFELKWDVNCTPAMRQQRISFRVDGVTTDELLEEVARVSRLRIVRDKQQVVVKP